MITLVGDTHGKFDHYLNIAQNSKYSIQIGDFGFSSSYNNLAYCGLDPNHHKIIPGNHCIYPECLHSKHCLGDFGVSHLGDTRFFFIRGGISIDRVWREAERINGGPKTWWHQEELNFTEMLACLAAYKDSKPDIVLSHAPPAMLIPHIHKKNKILEDFGFSEDFRENTSLLGDECLKIHRPKLWVSGHHHLSFNKVINGTRFVVLDKLEVAILEDIYG